jgi:hypothetical protein
MFVASRRIVPIQVDTRIQDVVQALCVVAVREQGCGHVDEARSVAVWGHEARGDVLIQVPVQTVARLILKTAHAIVFFFLLDEIFSPAGRDSAICRVHMSRSHMSRSLDVQQMRT